MRWCRGSVRPPPVGDLRDFDRYAVVAAEGYGSLGKALTGQSLTDDLLYRVHVVGQIAGVVAVRDFGLVYDTGAPTRSRPRRIPLSVSSTLGMMAFRPESVVSAESVEAESAEVSADAFVLSALLSALSALLSVDEVSLVSVADVSDVPCSGTHGPAARNVHSCYRRHAEEMMISMTAIKEVTLFFTCKCLL